MRDVRLWNWHFNFIALAIILTGCAGGIGFTAKSTEKTPKKKIIPPPPPRQQYDFRELRFASSAEEFRPQIKVGLVIDNSHSMGDEQLALSAGFEQLLNSFRNDRFNLSFHIFSTSQTGNNRATVDYSEFHYTDPATGAPVVSTDPAVLSLGIDGLRRRQGLGLALARGQSMGGEPLQIRTDMSSTEFNSAVQSIQQTISSMGVNGSDQERGLCSLGRMLAEENSQRRIFEENDLAALMIVSDANDANSDQDCRAYDEQTYGPSNGHTPLLSTNCRPNSTSCTEPVAIQWRYRQSFQAINHDWAQIRYQQASCVVDGQRRTPCPQSHWTSNRWMPLSALPSMDLTPEFSFQTCPANLVSWINNNSGWEDVREGAPGDRTCEYFTYRSTRTYDYTDENHLGFDLCSPGQVLFYMNGGVGYQASSLSDYYRLRYPDLVNFLSVNCINSHFVHSSAGGRYRPAYGITTPITSKTIRELLDLPGDPQNPLPPSVNLKEAIVRRAQHLFGDQGFIFSSIIHSDALNQEAERQGFSLSCQGPPESEGTRYQELADLLPEQAQSFPICLADYAPALQPLRNFIQYLIDSVYEVTLDASEEIVEVKLYRAGSEILLHQDTYEISGNRIQFDEGIISRGDEISLRIRKPVVEN